MWGPYRVCGRALLRDQWDALHRLRMQALEAQAEIERELRGLNVEAQRLAANLARVAEHSKQLDDGVKQLGDLENYLEVCMHGIVPRGDTRSYTCGT